MLAKSAFLIDGLLHQASGIAQNRSNLWFADLSSPLGEARPQEDQASQFHAVALGAHGAVIALVHAAQSAEVILGGDDAEPLEARKQLGVNAEVLLRKCIEVSHAVI